MRRREFVAGLVGVAAWPLKAQSQPAALPTIGVLHSSSFSAVREQALRSSLSRVGLIDGENIILRVFAGESDDDRLRAFAKRLVDDKAKLIVAIGTPAAIAASKATTTISIIIIAGINPVD